MPLKSGEIRSTVDGDALSVLNHFKQSADWRFAQPPYFNTDFTWEIASKVCNCKRGTFWAYFENVRTMDEVLVLCCVSCLAVDEYWHDWSEGDE